MDIDTEREIELAFNEVCKKSIKYWDNLERSLKQNKQLQ